MNKYFLHFLMMLMAGCAASSKKHEMLPATVVTTNPAVKKSEVKNNKIDAWIARQPGCLPLLSDKKKASRQQAIKCIDEVIFNLSLDYRRGVLMSLLHRTESFNFNKTTLTKILEKIAHEHLANEALAVTYLIKKGAKTRNINLELMRHSLVREEIDARNICKSVMAVVKNNKAYYKKGLLVAREPQTKRLGMQRRRVESDLQQMAYGASDSTIDCPEAAKQLYRYNRRAVDIQVSNPACPGHTPLHSLFEDFSSMSRDIELAKMLMTKKNINLQTHSGNTALHQLLLIRTTIDDMVYSNSVVIKHAISLGANLEIRNNEGVSVREMILEQPKLAALLAKELKSHKP